MELAYAFLATNASIHDGKLYVFDGDFDSLRMNPSPAVNPPFAVVVKLRAEPDEFDHPHDYRIEVSDSTGQRTVFPQSHSITVSADSKRPGNAGYSLLIATVASAFDIPGEYKIHVVVDSTDLAQLPLHVSCSEQAEWDELEKETFSSAEFSAIAAHLRSTGKASA
jgi:hypothetical protein